MDTFQWVMQQAGVDTEYSFQYHHTALYGAAMCGQVAMVRELVKYVRAWSLHAEGHSDPVIIATYCGHVDVLKILVPRFGFSRFALLTAVSMNPRVLRWVLETKDSLRTDDGVRLVDSLVSRY